jgi:hypothetical protein
MLTVLLPECALGVQLPAPGYFGNLLTLLLVANPVFDGLNWPLSPPGAGGGLPWSAGDATYNTPHHRPLPTDGRGSPTRSSGLTGRVTERLKPGLAARCPRINSTSVRA